MTVELASVANFSNPSTKLEKLLKFLRKEVSHIEPTHLAHPQSFPNKKFIIKFFMVIEKKRIPYAFAKKVKSIIINHYR